MKKTLAAIAWLILGGVSLAPAETGVYLAAKGAKAPPAPAVVELKVVASPHTAPVDGFPVSTGVPFADGQLGREGVNRLRVIGADGRPVPAQFSVRGTYPRSGNVRWLGVDFQLASSDNAYSLQLAEGPGPQHLTPVRVDSSGDAFVVSTGASKAEVPKQGGMLRRVWLETELVLEQRAGDGNWLTTVEGESHREAGAKAVVESEGPLHLVIRVDGHYADSAGKPSCKWTARLHFYAGRPEIGITHTFAWIGRADQFKIRDLAISFGLPRAAIEAAADQSDETLGESISRRLQPGEMLSLLQDEHWHWGHGESHFGILAGKPEQPEEIASGKRAGSWIGASDGRCAVTVALRDLWQQFPKELRAEPNRLTAYLWSSHGKAGPFDLSYDGLEKFWGVAVVDQLHAPGKDGEMYQRSRSLPQSNDPTGVAKTHDLLLIFSKSWAEINVAASIPACEPDKQGCLSPRNGSGQSPNLRKCAAIAETFDAPPLVLPDPHWTTRSEVIGRIWPKDDQRFAPWEQRIDQAWSDVFRVLDDWGDYGFFSYGDGPHQRYDFPSGRAVASIWRYTMPSDYGLHKAAWLGWLRSGDRRFYDFAVVRTRFINDLAICHEDTPTRWKGSFTAGIAPIPWATMGGARAPLHMKVGAFEFFIDHALIHYYLTGDQRSLDVAQEYATALRDTLSQPDWARNWVATMNNSLSRWYFQRIEDLAVLYEQFGDPWFYDKSLELARLGIDLADSSGIVREPEAGIEREKNPQYPTYIFYKAPNLIAYLRTLQGPDRDQARQAVVKMAEHQFRTQSLETRSIGPRMAYAYYFTQDPRWLAFGVKRYEEESRHAFPTAPGTGVKGYATAVTRAGAFRASAVNMLLDASHLMAARMECPDLPASPSPLLFRTLSFPPVEFALLKRPGKILQIELAAGPDTTFTGRDGQALSERWMGTPITYWPHNDAIALLNPPKPLLYRTVSIPAEAPVGEVRIRAEAGGMAYLFSTNASGAVMVAPQGFHLGGSLTAAPGTRTLWVGGGYDDCWYFRVPPQARGFRLATSDAARLVVRDPAGRNVTLTPLGGGQYSIAALGRAGHDGEGLWSVQAQEVTDVAFADIQPVFAYRDPKLYFVPEGLPIVRDLPTIPQAGIKVRRQPTPPAPTSAQPQMAPPPRQSGAGPPAATSDQQPRSARDTWVEKADKWHKNPLSLKTPACAIAENLYYVGNQQFSSHLLVGTKEIVLFDTPYPTHFDMLIESIRSVGVDPKKITLILHTHGHYDHYGATRRLVDLSGAKTALGAADLGKPTKPHIIEPGFIQRFVEHHGWLYEPFDVDILLKHGGTFDIGDTVVHCHHTPGHTKGTMTFTFDITMDGQRHTAVLWGGPGLHMFKPDQADDWARSFAYLKTLKADLPLGAHPFINDTLGKYERLRSGEKPSPFVDPQGWHKFLEKQEADFHAIQARLKGKPE
jgi:metallo-beta-lactamase class B